MFGSIGGYIHTYIHNLYLTWEKHLAKAILQVFHKSICKRIEGPKPHKYEKGYSDSMQHIVINTHSVQERLELSQQEVLKKITNCWMSEASGWVVN